MEFADLLLSKIKGETEREIQIFHDLQSSRDGIGSLKASTIIAHNFGDLDRVMDQWEIPENDPIRKLYKLGNENTPYGAMNRKQMAAENHRHLPLRSVKSLRRKQSYLLPLGPFFYEWGKTLASDQDFSLPEIIEIARTLTEGHLRLASRFPSIGYLRAVAGIMDGFAGGSRAFLEEIPANFAKQLRANEIARIWQMPENEFMKIWERKGL
jgi:hypothetical protein